MLTPQTHLRNTLLQTGVPVSFSMASDLKPGEMALGSIVSIFHKYASGDGDAQTLSKSEFDKLVKEQFPNLIPDKYAAQLKEAVHKIAGDTIDFDEFMNLMSVLSSMSHATLLKSVAGKKAGK
ncbi:protein S100-A6-like isoform X1 [Anguilla anguilla]|uniref:S100/CaBP-9k-type calcium binding subdomain domain-containing protein n=1 Tax=Anguilla anguilla TaxID=7936 RepID=A0A9D3M6S7_ANGAN|nr:protein S100-A6-like isoform X1 [Anguilla anguilla]KAG5842859.1 hypothetical protein ANANG_G00182220 [Anguilla anguilla]